MNLLSETIQKDFEEYVIKNYGAKRSFGTVCLKSNGILHPFSSLPLSAKFGIYQDYFWQVHKIWAGIDTITGDDFEYEATQYDTNRGIWVNETAVNELSKEINEARTAAIQQANKLAEQ